MIAENLTELSNGDLSIEDPDELVSTNHTSHDGTEQEVSKSNKSNKSNYKSKKEI